MVVPLKRFYYSRFTWHFHRISTVTMVTMVLKSTDNNDALFTVYIFTFKSRQIQTNKVNNRFFFMVELTYFGDVVIKGGIVSVLCTTYHG